MERVDDDGSPAHGLSIYGIYANVHNRSKLQTDVEQNHTQGVLLHFFVAIP